MALFKFNDDSLFASVDIGSYGIRCAVFEKSKDFPFQLLAWVEQKTLGLESSRITDFESLSLAFSAVLSQAEDLCKSSFSEVWLGFSPPFNSFQSRGMAALARKEVLKQDLDLAIETACAVQLAPQHICLHQRPQSFYVDSQSEVLNPLGLSGLRLETEVRLVSVLDSYLKDINKALKLLGYKPRAFFHNLITLGEHLTSFEQKSQGVCVCDIGYTNTRVIVFKKNKIKEMFLIPVGGHHFTQTLANQFNISLSCAEELKHQYGQVLFNSHIQEDSIEVPSENLFLSRKVFSQCLETLFEKLLGDIKTELTAENVDQLLAGFIFTGSTSYIKGFKELANFYLGRPVSHGDIFYDSFKKTHNLTLIKQAYLENKLDKPKPEKFTPLSFVKELF